MAGKSNFIEFFRFVKDLIFPSQPGLYGLNSALNPRGGFGQVVWKGDENPFIEFALEGDAPWQGGKADWRYTVRILGNFQWGSAQIDQEKLVFTDGSGAHVLIDTADQQKRLFGADGRQLSAFPDASRLGLEYEFPGWEASALKQSILSWKFYNLIPPLMRQPNPTAASESLNIHGDNLSAWLMLLQTRFFESFERIRNAACDVFPSLDSIFTNPTSQSTVFLSSKEKFLKRPSTIAEMSDGELAFLSLLSLIYAPVEKGADIYFLEELENHLHPRLLSVLMGLLRQVQAEYPEGGAQVVLTTHSPHLVDNFTIDELLIAKKINGATELTRPATKKELLDFITNTELGLGELYYSGALTGA